MKIYKLIPTHNILTSFSHKEAETLINLIEERMSIPVDLADIIRPLTKPQTKRLQSMKRSLVKVAKANKGK